MGTVVAQRLNEMLGLICSTATVTWLIYKGLTLVGRECSQTDRWWWTKKQVSEMEALALMTTIYFPASLYFGLIGEKATACLLALGFSLMTELFIFTVFLWPSTLGLIRDWKERT